MKKSLFLFLLILSLFSCKKDEEPLATSVQGRVFDPSTLTYYNGLKMNLSKKIAGTSSYETIQTITTDATGNYQFNFDADPDQTYVLRVNSDIDTNYQFVNPIYSDGGPYYLEKTISTGNTNSIQMNPATAAHFLFHVDGNNGADSMKIFVVHNHVHDKDYQSNELAAGIVLDFNMYFVPAGPWTITRRIWNSGVQADSVKTIYLDVKEVYSDTLKF